MTTQDKNKVIAEFMSWERVTNEPYNPFCYGVGPANAMDTLSIGWLWPVYGKLRTWHTENCYNKDLLQYTFNMAAITQALEAADLPALHEAIYNYIAYLNNNK